MTRFVQPGSIVLGIAACHQGFLPLPLPLCLSAAALNGVGACRRVSLAFAPSLCEEGKKGRGHFDEGHTRVGGGM